LKKSTFANAAEEGEHIPCQCEQGGGQGNEHHGDHNLLVGRLVLQTPEKLRNYKKSKNPTSNHFAQELNASFVPPSFGVNAQPNGNMPLDIVSLMITPLSVPFRSSAWIVRQPK